MPSSVQVGGQKLKLKTKSRCTVTRSVTSTSVTRDWTASNGKDAKSKLDTFGPGESKVCSFFNGSGWSAIKYGETDLVVDENGIGSVAGTKELPKGLQGWFKVGDSDGGWDDSPQGEEKKQEEEARGPHKSLKAILGIVDVKKKADVKVPVVIDPRLSKMLRPHQIEGVKVSRRSCEE